MLTKLYAAYGSNINSTQMGNRCPLSRYYTSGIIKNYELQFKGKPENSYATISKSTGSSVPVVIWCITDSDENLLDKYEGYPDHYQKDVVTVTLENGQVVEAMVYVMDNSKDFGMPSPLYYRSILEGYKEFGLDEQFLSEALGRNTQKYYLQAVVQINEEIQRRFPEPP